MNTWTLILLACGAALIALFAINPLRRSLLSRPAFAAYRKVLPAMSSTEKDALEAGTVWWEGEVFRGSPDWKKLYSYPAPKLTAEEQSFMDNEVTTLCAMIDDWKVTTEEFDLPPHIWKYIKDAGFLGMIIPKQYGGKQFSAYAHSQVVTRLSTRSSALSVSVMVPNSLGPAELLLHYGTEDQKNHYLPRLARGEEIPAFALTSPWAGSDAANIPDYGVVCKGLHEGKEVRGMKITFDKRYITLAPVCTVFGLAFRLFDPQRLLGGDEEVGITAALIPRNHPGVDIGRRHFPLNAMFMNGCIRGQEIFVPMDFIIGGQKNAGAGWRMLMDCLSVGRAISLPSSNVGMSQVTVQATTGYARVRSQFSMPVGKFEGVEEVLARMASSTYVQNACRTMAANAVDLGEKPSVTSAIAKYHVTEMARRVVNDGMDVIGGKGICLGPKNWLGRAYQQLPIGITVEGANILTRTLILYGQGAIRCHPYLLKEMQAAQNTDRAQGLRDFDAALWGHIGFTIKNAVRTLVFGLTGRRFITVNHAVAPELRAYHQQVTRLAAAYAFLSDVSLLSLGGSVKRREKLSGRLGDVMSYLFLATCAFKRYEEEGRQQADLPLVRHGVEECLLKAQEALVGVLDNFPIRPFAWLIKVMAFPFGKPHSQPSDALGAQIVKLLLAPSATRDRLTAEVFTPNDAKDPIGVIELALQATLECEPIEAKIRKAQKSGVFGDNPRANVRDIQRLATEMGVITAEEGQKMARRNALRDEVIHVDDFPLDLGAAVRMEADSRRTPELARAA